jgi:hypothetical protein
MFILIPGAGLTRGTSLDVDKNQIFLPSRGLFSLSLSLSLSSLLIHSHHIIQIFFDSKNFSVSIKTSRADEILNAIKTNLAQIFPNGIPEDFNITIEITPPNRNKEPDATGLFFSFFLFFLSLSFSVILSLFFSCSLK